MNLPGEGNIEDDQTVDELFFQWDNCGRGRATLRSRGNHGRQTKFSAREGPQQHDRHFHTRRV